MQEHWFTIRNSCSYLVLTFGYHIFVGSLAAAADYDFHKFNAGVWSSL